MRPTASLGRSTWNVRMQFVVQHQAPGDMCAYGMGRRLAQYAIDKRTLYDGGHSPETTQCSDVTAFTFSTVPLRLFQ